MNIYIPVYIYKVCRAYLYMQIYLYITVIYEYLDIVMLFTVVASCVFLLLLFYRVFFEKLA